MTYTRNIPISGDSLGGTRDRIRTNFQQIDTVMAVNHVAFNSSGEGKHKFVQTPDQTADVASGVNEPVFYATSISGTNLGVLQYSRGGSSAVPTPVTSIQSTSASISITSTSSISILDFTNITRAFFSFFAGATAGTSTNFTDVYWNGSSFLFSTPQSGASALQLIGSGNTLTLKNNTAGTLNIYWTLDLKRTS